MTRAVAVALVGLVVLGCAGEPCDGVAGTCLSVHVTPSSTVTRVDRLDFVVGFGADHGSATTPTTDGRPIALPVATAVELGALGAATVMVRVVVTGELGRVPVGVGTVETTIADGAHASARLSLGPESSPDLAAQPADAGQSCQAGGFYCGGDKLAGMMESLYRCVAGSAPELRGACANGCIVRPGQDDACYGGSAACVAGSLYCGGDKVTGDPKTLYRCTTSGVPAPIMQCPKACIVVAGANDACQ